ERLEANADVLSFHFQLPMRKSQGGPETSQKQRTAPPHRVLGKGRPPIACKAKIRPAADESATGRAPILLRDLADNPRTDGAAALANGEAQTLIHRNRSDQLHADRNVV